MCVSSIFPPAPSSLQAHCAFDGKIVCRHIASILSVALNPLKVGVRACGVSLLDLSPDRFDEVLVFHRAICRPPIILLPIPIPLGNAADRVLAIGVDADILGNRDSLHGSENGR